MKALALYLSVLTLAAQTGLDPAKLGAPPTDTWPTYNGDYSGRRYSTLSRINRSNIDSLTLAWIYRANGSPGGGGFGGRISSTPIEVNGVLYFSMPDHVWAVDARTGRDVWHYQWTSHGGDHIGNRGVAAYGNWLYVETPDCNMVSLNMKNGTERWHTSICDLDQYYFASMSPLVVRNHIITGVSGDDLDRPGYIESHDPETGALQWRWYVVPQKKGDPGADSWPSEEAMRHGGGMTWLTPTYDPGLNLIYVPTGNPQPVIAGKARPGANLFTASIVALNPDTGKMQWYFQSSPHDTHDWDATQTPVLFDAEVDGKPRKLVAQASRNGYFFVLDRATGKDLVSTPYVKINWSNGVDAKGSPIPNPAKEPKLDGELSSPNQGGATNWPPPTYDPDTGLFYVSASRAFSVYYIYDPSDKPEGWGGNDRGGWAESMVEAIDYKTGKVKWTHQWEEGGRSGLLSTAGNLLFTGDGAGNFIALDPANGNPLWHANLGSTVTNGPITYELDGRQYLVVAAGDTLFGFTMLR